MQEPYYFNHLHNLSKPNVLSIRNYQIDDIKATDLDQFLKIISLVQKYYTKCTNNLERVRATILIVKELNNEQP